MIHVSSIAIAVFFYKPDMANDDIWCNWWYVWYFYFQVFYEYQIYVELEINELHNNYYALVYNLHGIQIYSCFIDDEEI